MDPAISAQLQSELQRTHPDHVVYVPQSLDGSTLDTGNEHFLVSEHPQGGLFAVWTQSSYEGKPDQHVVYARSEDGGTTWSAPTDRPQVFEPPRVLVWELVMGCIWIAVEAGPTEGGRRPTGVGAAVSWAA